LKRFYKIQQQILNDICTKAFHGIIECLGLLVLVELEKAGLIVQLRNETIGLRGLGKVDKVYLDNTNNIFNLVGNNANLGNIRETFFFNQMSVKNEVISSKKADFLIDNYTFEVGGKNKQQNQIEKNGKSFPVQDDIEYGYLNVIPLWAFGLNY